MGRLVNRQAAAVFLPWASLALQLSAARAEAEARGAKARAAARRDALADHLNGWFEHVKELYAERQEAVDRALGQSVRKNSLLCVRAWREEVRAPRLRRARPAPTPCSYAPPCPALFFPILLV